MTAQPIEVHVEGHEGPWTEDDYFALSETRDRIELFDGSLIVSPGPTYRHQFISDRLLVKLDRVLDDSHTPVSAVDVRLQTERIFVPDVVVTSASPDQDVLEADQIALVCEVVSPGNSGNDRVLKMCVYATAWIPWYLLIEPTQKGDQISASLYRLEDEHYVPHGRADAGQTLRLPDPVNVELDPAELLRREVAGQG
ncbi:Uma2 family endonuclease [Flindersiella endophytica]